MQFLMRYFKKSAIVSYKYSVSSTKIQFSLTENFHAIPNRPNTINGIPQNSFDVKDYIANCLTTSRIQIRYF